MTADLPPTPRDPRCGSPINLTGVRAGDGAGVDVLTGVDLAVGTGEIVGVAGANGAGKTTLVRAIAGLLPFHGARIRSGTARV